MDQLECFYEVIMNIKTIYFNSFENLKYLLHKSYLANF